MPLPHSDTEFFPYVSKVMGTAINRPTPLLTTDPPLLNTDPPQIKAKFWWEGACIDIVTCKTRLQAVEDGKWKMENGT